MGLYVPVGTLRYMVLEHLNEQAECDRAGCVRWETGLHASVPRRRTLHPALRPIAQSGTVRVPGRLPVTVGASSSGAQAQARRTTKAFKIIAQFLPGTPFAVCTSFMCMLPWTVLPISTPNLPMSKAKHSYQADEYNGITISSDGAQMVAAPKLNAPQACPMSRISRASPRLPRERWRAGDAAGRLLRVKVATLVTKVPSPRVVLWLYGVMYSCTWHEHLPPTLLPDARDRAVSPSTPGPGPWFMETPAYMQWVAAVPC
ncbi:hypothetical protein HaLaN_03151 [Haematococcus lacustris]|uniref:Uncharacterized protein n=1 Tax=Haematococcus lacustris TaxID=44745 RepID=A0A699YFI2_HAELA|nr:hypothetical protein HaLaN_03151 [Haematococcus lacustris]